MEQNIKMDNQHVNNDKGNWCKRLRSRKGTTPCSSLKEASRTENKSVHKGEQSDRKISAPPPPKKQQNQRAADTAERTPTPLPDSSSTVPHELKTSEENHKSSSLSATPADASGPPLSGLSPQRSSSNEDIKHTTQPLPKCLNEVHSSNGLFTCARCKFYTKDIGIFLQHTHDVQHEPTFSADAKDACESQSHNLNNYLSLASTRQKSPQNCYPNLTEAVTRKEKERQYIWRQNEIQSAVENSTSPGLKLCLRKNPLKADSWMARGFLSLSGEGMLDENGLLKPEKTLEVTNQYLERTIASEISGNNTMIKEEFKNPSRPVTPMSLLLPKNETSLPPESVNPNNNELAILMEKNNISIPPNCTTKVQGFKMVDGKKHLVLKVIPAAKQEVTDTVEPTPCSTEGVLSNTTDEPQNLDQIDPACSVKDNQPCNGTSAHKAIGTHSPMLGETDADGSLMGKPAPGQCEDQGFCDGPNQGCDDNHCLNQDVTEDSNKAGDSVHSSNQEVMKQQLSNKTTLMPDVTHTVSKSADQTSVNETNASVDGWLSLAAEGDSSSESNRFPVSPSPPKSDTIPASPHQPCGDGKEHHKGSLHSTPPTDASGTAPSGLSPQRPEGYEDIKHTAPSLPKCLNKPHSVNGMFTCATCKMYTNDIGTFLEHTHNVRHGPPLCGDVKDACASQRGNLNNYFSLASTGLPLKFEDDSRKSPQNYYPNHTASVTRKEKERKYIWKPNEIQPKVENNTSSGLKLRLTKNPVKADSWMTRGFLSLSGEGMLDENGLLKPEKTLEVTNQYLKRTIASEISGSNIMIKEEFKNLSRSVTPMSLLLPKNETSLPPESVNPNNNELAILMEKNNISIPPNCTTKVQGFKMVDGKKHLVLKVIPAAKQEVTDTVEHTPCSTEGVLSNTTDEPQNLDQSDPACSVKDNQPCNGTSAHEAISTNSPVLEEIDTDRNPLDKPPPGQSEDQGFCDGPNQGCDATHCLIQDVNEDSHRGGDNRHSSDQEVMKQQLSNKSTPMPDVTHKSTDQTSVNETSASVDGMDWWISPAAEEDSSSESDGGFLVSQSPPKSDTIPASLYQPCGDGKEHSHTNDSTSSMSIGESHVPENNADGSEDSGTAESVKPPQGSALSIQTTCLQNSETSCSVSSSDATAQPITELRTVQAQNCTGDAVEKPDPQVLPPPRTETAVNNKRPRESSPDLSQDRPPFKARRDVDSEDSAASTSTEAGCWEPSPRHMEKTLRLFPFSCFQLIKKPQGEQPVVVLNHPDADIPEVANIMRVVHKYGNEVQKVVLCQRTLKALSDFWGDGGVSPESDCISLLPRRVHPRSTVKERFSLKLKLRRSGQNIYQVVNAGRQQSLRCWFCGRVFTNQEDFICHGQRHLMEATSDWKSWFKSQ